MENPVERIYANSDTFEPLPDHEQSDKNRFAGKRGLEVALRCLS